MAMLRLRTISLVLIAWNIKCTMNEETNNQLADIKPAKANNCPLSKIIEDIFKVHKRNKTGTYLEDSECAKWFMNSMPNVTSNSENFINKTAHNKLVNNIIASINRIKNNITTDKNDLSQFNEAIILNRQTNDETQNKQKPIGLTNSDNTTGINDLSDSDKNFSNVTGNKNSNKGQIQKTYVEILTIEPNNTSPHNISAYNIIEVLKSLIPLFNTTMTKELYNITIIERNSIKNNSFSATKNMSTIVVTYCDGANSNHSKVTNKNETAIKRPQNDTDNNKNPLQNGEETESDLQDDSTERDPNEELDLTVEEKKDILEATEYGMQKMHELYSIMEPKLYSMGLWLDDKNPARYVAAFNAPTEDVARFSRYGYATLQASTRFKQLTGSGSDDGLESRGDEPQFPSASALRQSPLQEHCPLKGAPKCPPASKRYRTHDGTCNNLSRPRWGSTMTPVQRFLPPSYSDGLQAPRRSVSGSKLPSAREISSSIHENRHVEMDSITHLLMQWGQFVDHDITSSSQSRGFNGSVPRCCKDGGRDFVPKEFLHPECLPISVPSSDPFYGPRGVRCLDFVRSSPALRDDCALGWREQMNQVSAYIDASPLYGSSARQSDKLRLFRNGMLQYGRVQQRRPLLPPERRDELCRGGAVSTECFKSGDGRVNEHPGLVAAHIVWLRQHNRMAQELSHLNPHWSDEKIYQETRKIIGAMIQHITYREFLPIVLGNEVMRLFELEPLRKGFYKNYSPKSNASPASSFGSAAFRFGHSLVQPSMVRYDRFHRPINNNVSLHDELTNPSNIWSMGAVDRLLLGMVNQPIQKRDQFITEELTNHLFQTADFDFGMDLAAINIQRGRDHGIPSYTTWREPCGLTALTEFEDLFRVMPSRTVRKLQSLYRSVDDIDLFTGGMAERPVVGGLVGPTFACIIAQQFSNLRKGDRFWYENGGFDSSFTPAQLQQIRRVTLAQVLCRTLDNIDSIQPFVFLSANSDENDRIPCASGTLNNFDLSPWVEIDNDINKAENIISPSTTQVPIVTTSKRPKTTTKKTNKIPQDIVSAHNKITHKHSSIKPANKLPSIHDTKQKPQPKLNKTDIDGTLNNITHKTNIRKTNFAQSNSTTHRLDGKLDLRNKTRRYENERLNNYNSHKDTTKQQYDYDYDQNQDSYNQQAVVINNLPNKRPSSFQRPVLAVTENVDKFTYLINYVPRPTQSWRRTTKNPYNDRDVVKVTYQTYDDTYHRRPNRPYYSNIQNDRPSHSDEHYIYRQRNPDTATSYTQDVFPSSARSNEGITTTNPLNSNTQNLNPSTENMKLVTFRYVGTYKGHDTKHFNNNDEAKMEKSEELKFYSDNYNKDISKNNKNDEAEVMNYDKSNNMKLSTFFLYETATRPYILNRPTRRSDDDDTKDSNYKGPKDKYYYVKNILHKYPGIDLASTEVPDKQQKYNNDFVKENYNNPGTPELFNLEARERSSAEELLLDEDSESGKTAHNDMKADKVKRPVQSAAKTPTVAFQIIPSENSPMMWAIYHEKPDLADGPPKQMPKIQSDPHALEEIPRPLNFSAMEIVRRAHRRRIVGN